MSKEIINNPFPHIVIDDFLGRAGSAQFGVPAELAKEKVAKDIQEEIINLPEEKFDKLTNPFEKKKLLNGVFLRRLLASETKDVNGKDEKEIKCDNIRKIFSFFESKEFTSELQKIFNCGHLIVDPTRYFYGIHKMDEVGSRLDVHIDANIHPSLKLKKRLTVLLYLSKDADSGGKEGKMDGNLELWNGTNSEILSKEGKLPELKSKAVEYSPLFNRLIVFDGTNNSYHGQPEPIKDDKFKRLLITLSYLSNDDVKGDTRAKALFLKRPGEIDDKEKEELRFKRANIEWKH